MASCVRTSNFFVLSKVYEEDVTCKDLGKSVGSIALRVFRGKLTALSLDCNRMRHVPHLGFPDWTSAAP